MDIDISMDSLVDGNNPPPVSIATNTCQECQSIRKNSLGLQKENLSLKAEKTLFKSKLQSFQQELDSLKETQFTYKNVRSDPDRIVNYTGISADKFEIIFEHVNHGSNSENIKFYETSKRTAEETISEKDKDTTFTKGKKPGPKPKGIFKSTTIYVLGMASSGIWSSSYVKVIQHSSIYSFTLFYYMDQLLIFLLG